MTVLPESELVASGEPPRVLLVDGSSARREVMRVVVETGDRAGTVVAQADTLAVAVAAVDRHDPDVAVLEIQPAAAGLAAIAALRAAKPSLVIVVCSFHADPSTRRQALVAGADIYLTKPVSGRELHAAFRTNVAAGRQLSRVR